MIRYDKEGTPRRLLDNIPPQTPDTAKTLYRLGDPIKRLGVISGVNFQNDQLIINTDNNGVRTEHPFAFIRLTQNTEPQPIQRGILYDVPLTAGTEISLKLGNNGTNIAVSADIVTHYDAMHGSELSEPTSQNWGFDINGKTAFEGNVLPIGRLSSAMFALENPHDNSIVKSIAETVSDDPYVSNFHALALIAFDTQRQPHLLVVDTSTNGTKVIFSPKDGNRIHSL